MGPQLYRCGNRLTEPEGQGAGDGASMGPQLYRCGNLDISLMQELYDWALQWGRNFIVAEILPSRYIIHAAFQLQWGRNFIVAEISINVRLSGISRKLQWGRNFIVAEMRVLKRDGSLVIVMLQWGRNFIVAEIGMIVELVGGVTTASMGPQLYRCGNNGHSLEDNQDEYASMGPQLYRCGNPQQQQLFAEDQNGFNGAATLSLRKWQEGKAPDCGLYQSFNGAATLSLRKSFRAPACAS